jgi:hypothetical protein
MNLQEDYMNSQNSDINIPAKKQILSEDPDSQAPNSQSEDPTEFQPKIGEKSKDLFLHMGTHFLKN